MNKSALITGLLLSAGAHVWVFWPTNPASTPPKVPSFEQVDLRELPETVELADARSQDEAEPVKEQAESTLQEPPKATAPQESAAAPVKEPVDPVPAITPQGPVEHALAAEPSANEPAAIHEQLPSTDAVVEQASGVLASEAVAQPTEAASVAQRTPEVATEPIQEHVPSVATSSETPQEAQTMATAATQPAHTPRRHMLTRPPASTDQAQRPLEPLRLVKAPQPQSPRFPWLKSGDKEALAKVARATELAASQIPAPDPAIARAAQQVRSAVVTRQAPASPAPTQVASATTAPARDRGIGAPRIVRGAQPVARIAWGDEAQALRLVDIGRMALVTVDNDLKIVAAVELVDGRWTRTNQVRSLAAYSNLVRVVDGVAGFSLPARACAAGEHLAVVVPVGLERRIDAAMDHAARREGLIREQVEACFGRLVPAMTGLEFEVDRVAKRSST